MMGKNIYYTPHGAPMKIGALVKIDLTFADETADFSLDKRLGTVIYFNYDCGCGQSFPNDPMIGVVLLEQPIVEEFWKEELICIP